MKKVLITGIGGFVGPFLAQQLNESSNYKVYGTILENESINIENVILYKMNLLSKESVDHVINAIKPEIIFHLAAQSSVRKSWNNPLLTNEININGSVLLLEAAKNIVPKCKIVMIGSSEEYGEIFKNNFYPSEKEQCQPINPYAITKVAQNNYANLYSKAYNMDITMTRSFNHCGPGQSEIFVVSDFCKQVAMIENNLADPIISVGNLNVYRDFMDVRDIVRIYVELAKYGLPGETYNIGSGHSIKLQDLLDKIIKLSSYDIKIEIDKSKYRPIDVEKIEANIDKIKKLIDFKQKYGIDQTIEDTLNYWRKKINK